MKSKLKRPEGRIERPAEVPAANKSVVQLKQTGSGGAAKKIEMAEAESDWKQF